MFDMSWSEMLLIAVVALIVIGPKDLPKVVKTLAGYARKARSLAREFQSGLEEMAREAELDDLKRTVEETVAIDPAKELENSIDPTGSTTRMFDQPPDYIPPSDGPPVEESPAASSPAALPAPASASETPMLEPLPAQSPEPVKLEEQRSDADDAPKVAGAER
jgi:sec-independent protein translocase protein TatB